MGFAHHLITSNFRGVRNVLASPLRREQLLSGYLFLVPALFGLFIFSLLPLLFAVWASFYDLPLIRPDQRVFLGTANYQFLSSEPEFRRSFVNTIIYAVIQMPAQTILGLILSLLVQQSYRGVSLFRSIFYLPVVISMVVASILWRIIYDSDAGLANSLLLSMGLPRQLFLKSTSQALPSIAAMLSWKWVGFSMIIFLAGLQAIPLEYYEAAKIDGASWLDQFRSVTLPLLKRPALFVVVTNTVNSFKLFTPIWVITQGGPEQSTTVLVFYIFRNAFRYYRMGLASAAAIVLLILLLILTFVQFRVLRSEVEY